MFSHSAAYYDIIYETLGKNYELEVKSLVTSIQQYQRSRTNTLLDVACGTGEHLKHLSKDFMVEGLDLDSELLECARRKLAGIPFHQANMLDFDLGRQFDVVVCLFSSIGYVVTKKRLQAAIKNMQRHTAPGGLLIVEPWFSPDQFHPGSIHAVFVNQPKLKIARMNISKVVDKNKSVLDFQYLIAIPDGIRHFTEHHELGLFTHDEYLSAFADCNMDTRCDEQGLDGRGLYIGINPF